ncbi:hypothetical protein [Lacticaseibacillus porcinae]|uniref:hypothetical protein n=1 Tax=Lacticaseibacillus porcinae TaxID=1123687 RepID=UPI000F799B6B|nr:hypothetical protein [Lacticaseibacillus porcinae]
MTQHTPIVEAFSHMVDLQVGELHAATANNHSRALRHGAEAENWFKASNLLIDVASEDEVLIMQKIYRDSEILPLREKVREMRHSKDKAAEPARPAATETFIAEDSSGKVQDTSLPGQESSF